jgi:protein-S-isoprenylcysteine O-methyltransferase Ste14
MIDKEEAMTAAQYSLLAALIFAFVAVLQFVRAVAGLPITIGRTSIPIWASWVACGVAIILTWLGYAASQG